MNSEPLSVNSGGEYAITQDLGTTAGNNLFHSFHTFNIGQSETATFSGAPHIDNVISRVTGGSPSHINGTLKNTIPGADTWLMNPAGLLFGEHAQLDVQGSFHATTADSLKFADGTEFHAAPAQAGRFSVSSPQSFGFLDNAHGAIAVDGRGALNLAETTTPRALLQVPEGESLSLIGGEIRLSQSLESVPAFPIPDALTPETIKKFIRDNQNFSQLYAPGGRVTLVAVQGPGEVSLTTEGVENTAAQGADIAMQQAAFISTAGNRGGSVSIRADEFVMDNSVISAYTLGGQDGGVVDVRARDIRIDNGSLIQGGTGGSGAGTDIHLTASETIRIRDNSPLNTASGSLLNAENLGDAGHIHLQAENITMDDVLFHPLYGTFSSDTYGTGRGGDVLFKAENALNISNSMVQMETWSDDGQAGNGGNLYLQAERVNVTHEAQILLLTEGAGEAGDIEVDASTVSLDGREGLFSVMVTSAGTAEGDAGDIRVQAHDVVLAGSAYLMSPGYGAGDAGDIDMRLTGTLNLRGASPTTGYAAGITTNVVGGTHRDGGNSGNITIQAQSVRLEAGARIESSSRALNNESSTQNAGNISLYVEDELRLTGVNPYGENLEGFGSHISANSEGDNAGQAGQIVIEAASVNILAGAVIESNTSSTGHGSHIHITARDAIRIQGNAESIALQAPLESQLEYLNVVDSQTHNPSNSGVYAHSTHPDADSGNGGSIRLIAPHIHLSEGGQISTASQGGGQAGEIFVQAAKLELTDRAFIRSDSELANQFSFASRQARDARFLERGAVVKIADVGDGRAAYQINIGDRLLNFIPITQVADMAALAALPRHINLARGGDDPFSNGYLVHVKDAGKGQPARFMYAGEDLSAQVWTRVDDSRQVVLDRFDESLLSTTVLNKNQAFLPYADGTPIHVKNVLDNQAVDYVYTVRENTTQGITIGAAYRVEYYRLADMAALQHFAENTLISAGMQVDVTHAQDGGPARFVAADNAWVRMGRTLEVTDVEAQQSLILAQPGHIVRLPDHDTIYTGHEWVGQSNIYHLENLDTEPENLHPQAGDLLKIDDAGDGAAFVYADGGWLPQIRGGDAGGIKLDVGELRMSRDSAISTASVSGGGGEIRIHVEGLAVSDHSRITTSVQEGMGNGGDLHLDAKFLVQDRAPVTARAVAGDGGNIAITVKGIYPFPPAGESPIDASSQSGVSGQVALNTPETNLAGSLFIVGGQFLQADELALQSCEVAAGGLSRFTVRDKPPGRPATAAELMY